ncbi:translation initiation factor IF-2-like [Homo sapiens]|uniref:translation initiation factor IF-2-like n=1 Tax=Homo sapiens TaxID=9606 RepID=UPI001FB0D1E8|nr:translation initiation factor IF-2-like [Homo sapiens]
MSSPVLEPNPGPRPRYLHGPYLLLGEVLGHSALGAQPAQAANGDADELLELPALLQLPAGCDPCASLRDSRVTPATALLPLSHRGRAQRRSMHAAAAQERSLGRGCLGKEPPNRESWTRSDPRHCISQDASRSGSRVCRSRPQTRGGGGKKPRRQKDAAAGAKSRGGKKPRRGRKPRRRGQKSTAAGAKSRGEGGKKPRQQKPAAAGAKSGLGDKKSRRWGRKKPGRWGQEAVAGETCGGGGKKPQKAAAPGAKSHKKPRRQWQKAAAEKVAVAGAESCGGRGQKAAAARAKSGGFGGKKQRRRGQRAPKSRGGRG